MPRDLAVSETMDFPEPGIPVMHNINLRSSSDKKLINSAYNDLCMCGLEARGSVRAFIAIELPEAIRQKLMAFEKEIANAGGDVKLVEFENLHVTMKFLGDVSEASIERIAKVMGEVKAKPYQLRVKGTGVFPNNRMVRVLWAGTAEGKEETVSIFRQLDEKLAQMGFPKE
ncbi:MAG: RNA 2',3'-cyclic phosphodiesterase, partial [Candidatus Methanomethylicus sp.]|nr:RNA 2',3'-cyclic phosphodiesterase [Candidatus Methanomethylicus sp.]